MVKKTYLVIVATALVLTACGGGTPTATPEAEAELVPIVSITGKIVPAAWAALSAQAGGQVLEVAVEPGDAVAAGDVLVRLDPTNAQLAVQQAEAALAAAQAQLALLKAGPRPEEEAAAEAQINAAQAAVSQAAAQRDQLAAGAIDPHYEVDLFVRALVVALVTGAIGGLYPAWRATRMRPVEALRYE